jgi:hypothetical protein
MKGFAAGGRGEQPEARSADPPALRDPRLFADPHSHCVVFYRGVETAPGTIWYGAATSFSFGPANPNSIGRTPRATDRKDGGLRYRLGGGDESLYLDFHLDDLLDNLLKSPDVFVHAGF